MRPEAEDGTGDVGGTRPGGLGGIGKNVCQKLKKAIELSLLYSIARAVDPSGLVKCLVCPRCPRGPLLAQRRAYREGIKTHLTVVAWSAILIVQ